MPLRQSIGVGVILLVALGCGDDSTPRDGSLHDGGSLMDGGGRVDAAPPVDAGPPCGPRTTGVCPTGLTCECCELGGPLQRCLCTTTCTSSDECLDSARGTCDVNPSGAPPPGLCRGDDFTCCWGCD